MTAGASTIMLRSAIVPEVTPGTTPSTPGFKTLHQPIYWKDNVSRYAGTSIIANGSFVGDALLKREGTGSITDADIVYGAYDALFESLFQGSFSTDVLDAGTGRNAFTSENSIPAGEGGTSTMKRYRGVEAIGGTIKGTAGGPINFSMDFMGMQTLDTTTTAIAGATYTDPTNRQPFSATTDIGAITIGPLTLDEIQSIEMNFVYEKREGQMQLGGDTMVGLTRGAFKPVIKFRSYVGANVAVIWDEARVQTGTGRLVTVNLGSETGKKYKFEFHTCFVQLAEPDFTGPSAFLDWEVRGNWSASDGTVMTLTRAIA